MHRDDARHAARRLGESSPRTTPRSLAAELQTLAAELEELTQAVERSSPAHVEPGEYRDAQRRLSRRVRAWSAGSIFPPDTTTTVSVDELDLARQQRRERDRAAGLDHQSDARPGPADRAADFVFADGERPGACGRCRMPKVIGDTRGVWSASHKRRRAHRARPARSRPARASGPCRPSPRARR